MTIAFVTVDLYPGREWLMPWRTVFEVSRRMRELGIETDVITLPVSGENAEYEFMGTQVKTAPRDFAAFAQYVNKGGYDVVIYPTPWREALKGSFKALKEIRCRKIAYIPGGVYSLGSCLTLARWGGMGVAKPYLLDALTPDCRVTKVLSCCGFEAVVGLTPYTAERLAKAGAKKAVAVVTAQDSFNEIEAQGFKVQGSKFQDESKDGLPEKFLLFSGAPAATRGAKQILLALDRVKSEDVRVVMLMRTDVGSDYEAVEETYRRMVHKERVIILRQKVTREQLRWMFGKAWYKLLPFVVIPSEIPVTYLEVLSCGTPIITFENGGTTRLLKEGLLLADRSISSLAATMERAWNDISLHDELSNNAKKIMASYPTWDDVAEQWIKLL